MITILMLAVLAAPAPFVKNAEITHIQGRWVPVSFRGEQMPDYEEPLVLVSGDWFIISFPLAGIRPTAFPIRRVRAGGRVLGLPNDGLAARALLRLDQGQLHLELTGGDPTDGPTKDFPYSFREGVWVFRRHR